MSQGNVGQYSYDVGEGHISILPWHSSSSSGTWGASLDASQLYYGFWVNGTTGATGESVSYKLYMGIGTYTCMLLSAKGPKAAIITVLIDNTSVGTIDAYAAGLTYNQLLSAGGITITTPGLKTLSLSAATRNASNTTGWLIYLDGITLFRTS
jgi:hypothetical protein